MNTKTFNLSLPIELVKIVDRHAKLQYSTRSEYIKNAIIAQLKLAGTDPTRPSSSNEIISLARKESLRNYLTEIELSNEDIR